MPEPASRTNDAAIWVTAKSRRRRFVPVVIRRLPLERLTALVASAPGRRGTKASSTAASAARPTPTHSRLESTVRSSARTENRDAYWARIATIGRAISTPRTAPAPQSTRLSASSVRRSAEVLAPSAARTASSPSRRTDRARIRFATLEQAIRNTRPDAASRISSTVRAGAAISSRSGRASILKFAFGEYDSGCERTIAEWTVASSARALSSVAPGASRPKSSVIRCTRPVTIVAERWCGLVTMFAMISVSAG